MRRLLLLERSAARAVTVLVLFVACILACGEDEPTGVGQDLRTAPDTLLVFETSNVVTDSVYSLPVSLRRSPTGQIGKQGPYTAQILYDFRVPSFIVEDADTLRLTRGHFEVDLTKVTTSPFTGIMHLGMREVALAARGWSTSAVFDSTVLTALPELLPTFVGDTLVADTDFQADEPKLTMRVDVHSLVDFDSVLARSEPLTVNVALVFLGFTAGGPGFVNFQQINAASVPLPRFVGSYVDPLNPTTTGSDSPVGPARQLVVVEFDSAYSPGSNWVVSDAQRFHTFFSFPALDSLRSSIPQEAFVHRADLILTQAARGDTIFGVGPNVGVIVPSDAALTDSTLVFSEGENNRPIALPQPESQTDVAGVSLTPNAGVQVVMEVTVYLFEQQEGTVKNRGMILRLSNEGTGARHFEFLGPTAIDTAQRPRLRIIYGLPADFGEGHP